MQALFRKYLASDTGARTLQISGLLRFILIFLQGILLVQAGVPIAVVGQLELIFFVANFLQYFWQNGSHQAMMSWKSGEERGLAAGPIFMGMHLQALVGVILLLIIALLPVGEQYAFLLNAGNLIALAVYVFFSIPIGAIIYTFLVAKQYRAILWYTVLSYGLQVGVVLWMLIGGYPIEMLLSSLAIFSAIRWFVVLLIGGWFSSGIPRWTGTWGFFVFALPLVLHAFYGGVMDYVDGWIVSLFFGEESFAYYRFGARELPLNAMLIGGLVSGLINQYKTSTGIVDSAKLKDETARMIRVLLPINCVLVLISPLVYPLLYNDDFILSARIFNIYVLTLLSRVVLNQVYCYVNHRNWVLTWSAGVEIAINIVLSLVLMQYVGLLGIPIATVIAYALQKLYLIYYVQRRFQVKFAEYMPARLVLLYTVALIACVFISELIYF